MNLFGPLDVEKLKARKDVKGLIKAVGYTRDRKVQVAATRALVSFGDIRAPADVETLLAALHDQDADVREVAALALIHVCDPRAVEPLIGVLTDASQLWDMRWRAASALGQIRDRRAVEPLIAVLAGKDPDGDTEADVRRNAAAALSRIGNPRGIGPLIAALKDPHALMRWEASEALGRMGAPAVEPLIAALQDQQEIRRWVVVGQPGRGERRAVMETVGRDAARALGRIGDARAVQPLVDALRDSHDEVRQAARAALVQLGAPAVEPLITALGDPQPEVRQAAAGALVSLYRSGKLDEVQKARLLTQRSAIANAGVDFPA